MDNSNTIVPLNKRKVIRSMRSGLAFYSNIIAFNRIKVSIEYNDNIMKLNNLEKRNERNVSSTSLNSNDLNPLTGEMYYR